MSRHSERVRKLRVIMPIAALLLVISIFAWPFVQNLTKLRFEGVNKNADQLTIVKPRYAAKDNKNNPFEVTADNAVQKTAEPDIIHLQNPAANIALNGHVLNVNATSGIYDKNGQSLMLSGVVTMARDDGLHLDASDTHMNLATGLTTSDLPLKGTSDGANLEGQGFTWDAENTILTVKGHAKLILLPKENPS